MFVTITCAVMLEQDGQLLLVQEAAPAIYGKWNQPAGHLEAGETLFSCALREAREESGYVVELTGLQAIYTHAGEQEQRLNFCFRAQPCGEPGPVDPVESVTTQWFTKDALRQLPTDQLRHTLAQQRIDDWLVGKCVPLDVIADRRAWEG